MSALYLALTILGCFAAYAAFVAVANWRNRREVERLIDEQLLAIERSKSGPPGAAYARYLQWRSGRMADGRVDEIMGKTKALRLVK